MVKTIVVSLRRCLFSRPIYSVDLTIGRGVV
jgi:hypothetical protein